MDEKLTVDKVKYWIDVAFSNYDDDFNAEEVENARIIAIRSLEAWDKVLEDMQDIMIAHQDEERVYQEIKKVIKKHLKEVSDGDN